MMFVHYPPASVTLTKAHGEAELELNRLAIALRAAAAPDGRRKGHLRSSGDFQIMKVELDWSGGPGEERPPRCHVGVQAAHQQGWGYIEHQDLGVVIGADPGQVLLAHRFGPSGDQFAKLGFIVSGSVWICG